MRRSLTRALAGTAVVAAAMLAAAGTASAAGVTTKAPTTLTASDSKATIMPGQSDLITGTLKSGSKPVVGVGVFLERSISGKFVPVQFDKTGGAGHVFYTVKPSATSTYVLVFKGNASFAPSRSNTVRVVVVKPAPAPTTLTATDAKSIVNPGQKDLITGTLKSGTKPVVGVGVFLERLVSGKFVPVQFDKTGGLGHVFYTVKPSATSTYVLVFKGNASFLPSRSNVLTITVVKASTTLTATASKSTIKPGQSDLITGTLTSGGKAVAGQIVYLERFNGTKFVPVNFGATGGAGHVFFTVKPSKTAVYELVFKGTFFYAGSHSNTVTVVVS